MKAGKVICINLLQYQYCKPMSKRKKQRSEQREGERENGKDTERDKKNVCLRGWQGSLQGRELKKFANIGGGMPSLMKGVGHCMSDIF